MRNYTSQEIAQAFKSVGDRLNDIEKVMLKQTTAIEVIAESLNNMKNGCESTLKGAETILELVNNVEARLKILEERHEKYGPVD